jgi:hypothetical protein
MDVMAGPTREFWDKRFQSGETPWDRGDTHPHFVQLQRPGAADGAIEGPPYHCDINAMRALFPDPRWEWPKPPYPRTTHPRGLSELAVVLKHQRNT